MDSKETQSSGCFSKSVSVVAGDDEPICLSSATSCRSYGAGESYMQNLHHNKGMIPQPPPPVAMSLRARESSSMALKQIFDQISNGAAFSREQDYKSAVQGQGFQSTRNQSMPDLRKRIPELDLSFRRALDNNPPYAQTGFGSPISTPTATSQSQSPQPSWPGPMNGQLMQHSYLPQAASSTRPSPSSRQPTAQMTIFYSGNVNVYDDVPADKARAIMLLAGNSWVSNFRCPGAPPASTPFSRPAETMTMKESAPSPMKATQSQQQAPVAITNTNGGGIARSFGSSAPATSVAAASLASPPPSPAPAPLADNIKISQAGVATKRPNTGIELPHARKASLARFLEKRKDRVQVQQVINPDQQAGAIVEKGGGAEGAESASCGGKPDCPTTTASSKRQCTQTWSRSPSPPSRSASNSNNTAVNMIHEDGESPHQKAIINEHRFFQ